MPARIVRMHRLAPIRTDEHLQDEFDALTTLACNGDGRALGAIAIALTPTLLGEARAELGGLERHAAGVVAEALMTISEGPGGFDPTHERASVWMTRYVREIARIRLPRLMALRPRAPIELRPAIVHGHATPCEVPGEEMVDRASYSDSDVRKATARGRAHARS